MVSSNACSDWASAYVTTEPEEDGYYMDVQGQLPSDLTGTYFRNGPGTFELGDQLVTHPFDGAGLVSSIAIWDGKAFFRSRYVDTAERRAELQQNKVLFRGTFGTQQPGRFANLLDVVPKNAANTNVLLWADKCWALFEAGQPHRLDPYTLETVGLDLLGGHLRAGVPFTLGSSRLDKLAGGILRKFGVGKHLPAGLQMGGDALTAHPRVDPPTGNLVMYSYRLRLGPTVKPAKTGKAFAKLPQRAFNRLQLHTEITFWEFDQGMQLISKCQHSLPGYAFLHDFTVTQHYYVIFQNPVGLDLLPFLLGRKAAVHAVRWDPNRPLAAHLIPRPSCCPLPTLATPHCARSVQDLNVPPGSSCESGASIATQRDGCGKFFKGKKDRHSQTNVLARHPPSASITNLSNSPGTVQGNLQRHSSATDTSTSSSNTCCSSSSSSSSNTSSGSRSNLTDCCLGGGGTALCERQAQAQLCLTQQTGVDDKAQVSCSPHVSLGMVTLPQQRSGECDATMLQPPEDAQLPKHSQQHSQTDGNQVGLHVIKGDSGFVFHHANAFETADRCVVVDAIRYPTLPDFEQACGSGRHFVQDVKPELQPISQLWRLNLDPGTSSMQAHPLAERAMEYPTVNPHLSGWQTRFVYTAAALHPTLNRPQQALVKTDMQTGQAWLWCKHDRYYAGEPAFVPKQSSRPSKSGREMLALRHGRGCDCTSSQLGKQCSQQQQQQQPYCNLEQLMDVTSSGTQDKKILREDTGRQQAQQDGIRGDRQPCECGAQSDAFAQAQHRACLHTSTGSAEEEGWILALCYDAAAHCSELVVLDAQNIEAGPIAILPLRKTIPHGLHGNWSDVYFGPSV